MGTRGDEIDVGLHRVARCWKNAIAAKRLVAGKTSGFDQPKPLFDSAWLPTIAIVIEDALTPSEAEAGIFAARENRRVFNRNAALVVVAIQSPSLKLPAR